MDVVLHTRHKALFLRRGAPRHWTRKSLRPGGRGASHASKPCSFVAGHHVIGPGGVFVRMDVVLHMRQSLAHSSRGTTSLGPRGPPVAGRPLSGHAGEKTAPICNLRLTMRLRTGAVFYSATCYLVLLEFLEFLASAIAAAAMRAAPTMMKRCVPMPPVDGSGSGFFGVNSQVPVNFTFPFPSWLFSSPCQSP